MILLIWPMRQRCFTADKSCTKPRLSKLGLVFFFAPKPRTQFITAIAISFISNTAHAQNTVSQQAPGTPVDIQAAATGANAASLHTQEPGIGLNQNIILWRSTEQPAGSSYPTDHWPYYLETQGIRAWIRQPQVKHQYDIDTPESLGSDVIYDLVPKPLQNRYTQAASNHGPASPWQLKLTSAGHPVNTFLKRISLNPQTNPTSKSKTNNGVQQTAPTPQLIQLAATRRHQQAIMTVFDLVQKATHSNQLAPPINEPTQNPGQDGE